MNESDGAVRRERQDQGVGVDAKDAGVEER